MPESIRVVTPDHIELEFTIAGLGSRIVAGFVDLLIQSTIIVVGFIVALTATNVWAWTEVATIIALLLLTLGQVGYWFFCEWLWRGQTPGKRLVGIRVVRDDGQPAGPLAILLRTLLRLVDSWPYVYGVGMITAFANPQNKRLGDLVAGTVVIVDRPIVRSATPPVPRKESPRSPWSGRFSREEIEAARRYLERRDTLTVTQRSDLSLRLARRIAERASVTVSDIEVDPEGFLQQVVDAE